MSLDFTNLKFFFAFSNILQANTLWTNLCDILAPFFICQTEIRELTKKNEIWCLSLQSSQTLIQVQTSQTNIQVISLSIEWKRTGWVLILIFNLYISLTFPALLLQFHHRSFSFRSTSTPPQIKAETRYISQYFLLLSVIHSYFINE